MTDQVETTQISAAQVKALRDATGAGMMDCKRALSEAGGDMDKATELLRTWGMASAQKKAGRSASQGVISTYNHFNGQVAVIAEVNCETDFVANTDEFKSLASEIALHIASMAPRWVDRDQVPTSTLEVERRVAEQQAKESGKPENVVPKIVEGKLEAFFKDNCLLDQKYVRDDSKTVAQLIDEAAGKLGEKVAVRRFARYKVGEELEAETA
jgi:elongation factor Ts